MKILRLRFTNLNSLRDEWSIDFTKPPLSDAGLFAITGPTVRRREFPRQSGLGGWFVGIGQRPDSD
jgi:hypothetical protein